MNKPINPFGLHHLTPYLVVANATAFRAFLITVFEAVDRGAFRFRADDSVAHAELQIGDSVVMFSEPDEKTEPTKTMHYVYVEDCDAAYQRALTAGATSIEAPLRYSHGDRVGCVRDGFGNTWFLVTHMAGRGG